MFFLSKLWPGFGLSKNTEGVSTNGRSMKRTCAKCGWVNTEASGVSTETCPGCGAIYSKVEAAQKLIGEHRRAKDVRAEGQRHGDAILLAAAVPPPPSPAVAAMSRAHRARRLTWVIGCLLVIAVLGRVFGALEEAARPKQGSASVVTTAVPAHPAESPAASKERAYWAVTPKQLLADFKANEVRANADYADHDIVITGTVSSISTDFSGAPMIMFERAEGDFGQVSAHFIKGQDGLVAQLDKGSGAAVRCDKAHLQLGSVYAADCWMYDLNPTNR